MKQGKCWAVVALCICLLLAVTAAGCISQPAEETEITVFAAASLTGALTELGEEFEKPIRESMSSTTSPEARP